MANLHVEDDWAQENDQEMEDDEDDDILGLNDEDQEDEAHSQKVVLMKFCPHDSSMLYPQENKRSRTLRYACRLCRYTEEATNNLIYQNILKKEVGNVLHTVPSAVSDDPTLARSKRANCTNCGHNEAVFFQSDTKDARSDTLALIFVCCNCDHKWVG
mmetsp:Transcript_13510/g.20572  ORF Transcript_13510/g.20572 Transcript_13510/m.20572 type:complete len:158 (-) Transcript_13510:188-661(-)